MSKHSKWAKVKNHKGVADQKKAGVFTKHARAVAVAARDGADPNMNFKLRMAIDAARADNVPMDNIDRAIARGSGADAADQMKEVLYEGFGPAGSAVLVEAVTENSNRTVANVRHVVSKHGGNLAGSVQWMFERRGVIRLPKSAGNGEAFQLQLIEAGADDFEEDDDGTTVFTSPEVLESMRAYCQQQGWTIEAAESAWIPKEQVELSLEDGQKLETLISDLELDDDVQRVTTNVALG